MKNIFRFALLFVFVVLLAVSADAKQYRVAVIADSERDDFVYLIDAVNGELTKIFSEKDIVLLEKTNAALRPFEDESAIQALIYKALRNEKYDAVLTLGPVSSHLCASMRIFRKPVIAAHIVNGHIQGIAKSGNSSGVKNLSYIDFGVDFLHQIEAFRRVKEFDTLHLIMSPNYLRAVPHLAEYLKSEADKQKTEIIIAETGKGLDEMKRLLVKAKAAMIVPIFGRPFDYQKEIIELLNELKVPSMAMLGRIPVENGVFCSLTPDIDNQKLARRIAINLNRIFAGDDAGSFNTDFTMPERLAFNMETAEKIGVFPTWSQMTDAILFYGNSKGNNKQMDIGTVIETALTKNLRLIAKNREKEKQRQKTIEAKSAYDPVLQISLNQLNIDKDRADSILTPAQHSAKLGADLLYVIHSEKANANIDIQRLFESVKSEEERALMLDIIKEALMAYVNVSKSHAMVNIQKDNLEVTRVNLEMAKLREKVGTSGPGEVYRWEIQMAGARQAVIGAQAVLKKAVMALNEVLQNSQEEEFDLDNFDLSKDSFYLNYVQMEPYIDNLRGYKIFKDFMVADTFEFSPEIRQIDGGIAAAERLLKSEKKRGKDPTVALQLNFTRTFKEWGTGDEKFVPPPFNSVFKIPDKNDSYIGLNVSLPVFEGRARTASIKQVNAEVLRLKAERDYLKDRLELNTRVALEDAKASFASINLANSRAEYAEKMLALVQNAYSRGAVSVLDLIDAQNAFLVAKEAAADAVFSFVKDFVYVCRAVGSYDIMLDEKSNAEWFKRLRIYYADKSEKPNNRKRD
ncbi:MAG: outer membrane channel protein [bacterium ADurb.Bin157]|nr:MAG: outer membrane channel protein [bacterium ADurb.Bin157]